MYVKFAQVAAIVKAAFADYAGRKDVHVDTTGKVHFTGRYWHDGYKNDYCIVRLADMAIVDVAEINPLAEREDYSDVTIPAGFVVVCRKYQGCGQSVALYAAPETMAQSLPAPKTELTEDMVRVLFYTRSCKSSYGGNSNYRQESSGLSVAAWQAAKVALQAIGYLDKRGALTTDGKNAASGLGYSLPSLPMISKSA